MKNTRIPVRFKQLESGGCGFYALANLFDKIDYIQYGRPSVGNNCFQLNEAIAQEQGPGVHLAIIARVHSGAKEQNRLTDTSYLTEDVGGEAGLLVPYLISVMNGEVAHSICVFQNCENIEQLFVVDSLDYTVKEFKVQEFFDHYHVVTICFLYGNAAGTESIYFLDERFI